MLAEEGAARQSYELREHAKAIDSIIVSGR